MAWLLIKNSIDKNAFLSYINSMLTKEQIARYQFLIKKNPHIIQTCESLPVNIKLNNKKRPLNTFKEAGRELLENFN